MSVRLAAHLGQKLSILPKGSAVLLRKGRKTPLGTFETIVDLLARDAGLKVVFYTPIEGDRSAVFRRDYLLVNDASYVEAYFADDRVMEGGTGHVVEAALAKEVPVYAWSVSPSGVVERVGEVDTYRD